MAALLIIASLLVVRSERARTAELRARWEPMTAAWVTRSDLDAGHLLGFEDLVASRLPPAALPADAATDPPVGRRLADAMGQGEIVRRGRLSDDDASANGSVVGPGRGAVALNSSAVHLDVGDRVDLFGLLDGERLATGAEVIDLTDGFPVVALDSDDLPEVIRAFTLGDVVPVLVG